MDRADERWLRTALAAWPGAVRRLLLTRAAPLPRLILFDASCTFELSAGGRPSKAVRHSDDVTLPNGERIPVQPTSFAAETDRAGRYVVMSLPSVWKLRAPPSDIPLETFLEAVLFHELAHDHHFRRTSSTKMALSGDTQQVQDSMASDRAYGEDAAAERDQFYQAATANQVSTARELACSALDRLKARRARHFIGDRAHLAVIDELSLSMEGLGQWTMYAWLTRERGLPSDTVLTRLRSSRWSLDEGLALFLAIDRLVPDWQRRMLGRRPETASALLESACAVRKPEHAAVGLPAPER